jgi:hypothetical protein
MLQMLWSGWWICFHTYVVTVCSKMFQLFQSSCVQQVFSYCKLQVFYLDIAYVFIHMLQVYVPDVSSVSDVCCIQVFHVARVSCCSKSQGGRGEPVASGHGAQSAGAGGRGHDGSGVRLRRQGEQMGWVRRWAGVSGVRAGVRWNSSPSAGASTSLWFILNLKVWKKISISKLLVPKLNL